MSTGFKIRRVSNYWSNFTYDGTISVKRHSIYREQSGTMAQRRRWLDWSCKLRRQHPERKRLSRFRLNSSRSWLWATLSATNLITGRTLDMAIWRRRPLTESSGWSFLVFTFCRVTFKRVVTFSMLAASPLVTHACAHRIRQYITATQTIGLYSFDSSRGTNELCCKVCRAECQRVEAGCRLEE